MTIQGFENRELLLDHIAALEREAAGHTWNERHREEIKKQIKTYKLALKENDAEGDPVVEKRRGTASSVRNATTGQTYQTWVN